MGHQHSAQQADESCFRACLRDKKVKTFKSPAGPVDFPKHSVDALYPSPESYKTNEESKKLRPLGSRRHLQNSLKDSDTSIQLQKQNQTKPNTQVKGALFSEQKQTVLQEKVYENQQQVGALGLQSKFSSHRSKTKVLDKAFKTSEGTTHCVSQKEVGSSQEASTKSQQTQGSTRSRKILLNKIQDIKQKYFERELQIEIYQEENDYQQRLDQVAELELQCSQGQGQPLPREITSPKKTLIHNFSRRKLIRNNLKKQNSPQQQNPQPNLQLELQSRNSIRQAQPQQDLKSFKKITAQDRLNRSSKSIDASQDVSLEQRVEFSQYSEQDTLQEIRECDEEDEDYKSKFDRGVLPFKPPLSRNNKQPSEAITEKHSESAKSVKVRGAEPSKCSSVRQIRASASPRSSRAEGDNKILFF